MLEHSICGNIGTCIRCGYDVLIMQNIRLCIIFRHKTDRERQKQLAKLRTEFRQKKLALGYTFERELDEYARPEKSMFKTHQIT